MLWLIKRAGGSYRSPSTPRSAVGPMGVPITATMEATQVMKK
jgi:hypothetical protein